MTKDISMSIHATHTPRFRFFRRIWKPATITGAGGTAIAIWFEEIIAFGAEILALIFLPLMAGLIYLLDIFIFKSRTPKREDFENPNNQGVQK